MTRGLGQSPAPEGPHRAMARLYDQQLRLFAAHYSNMWDGRSNSAAVVSAYFHDLVDLSRPALFVEAGAYRAEASRRTREQHPDCRVVAFEANPYNYEKYVDELGFADLGIEYRHLALTESAFHLRSFLEAGFLPLTRDAEYNQHYNIIFVRADVYERPDVLWSHELHTNYVTQHMGVRHADEPPAADPTDQPDTTRSGPRRRPWGRSSRGS
jgi:hypothetical protein